MSPILTRPVREQLEHDRVIRLLQARYKRKSDVIINPGHEQNQSVTVGELVVFPDLLLFAEGGRKLIGTVEVETGESINSLEARAEWGVFTKLKVPLHLYVPPTSVDAARRLCAEYNIPVAEVWTYHASFDQVRFTLIHRSPDAPVVQVKAASKPPAKPAKPVAKPDAKPVAKPVAKPAAKPVAKPAAKAARPKPAAKAKPAARSKPAGKPKPAKRGAKPKPAAKAKASKKGRR